MINTVAAFVLICNALLLMSLINLVCTNVIDVQAKVVAWIMFMLIVWNSVIIVTVVTIWNRLPSCLLPLS